MNNSDFNFTFRFCIYRFAATNCFASKVWETIHWWLIMHQTLYSFRGAMQYFRHDFGSVVTGSNSILLQIHRTSTLGQIWWRWLWIHNMFTAISGWASRMVHICSTSQCFTVNFLQGVKCIVIATSFLRFLLVWAWNKQHLFERLAYCSKMSLKAAQSAQLQKLQFSVFVPFIST